jgi:penicillin-binding protein 1A
MALGGLREGVSPLEQAAAYATFAAGGQYAEPYAITKILDRRGRTIFERRPDVAQRFDRLHVGVLNGALVDAVRRGTGRAAAIGRPVAGKTGTTDDYVNAWFAGFVPQLATAVWVGYPDSSVPMTDVHGVHVAGGTFPARIFGRYMADALRGVPVRPIYTASPNELHFAILNTPSPAPQIIVLTPPPLEPAVAAQGPPTARPQTYADQREPPPTVEPPGRDNKKNNQSCPTPTPSPSGSPTPTPSESPTPTPSSTPC